MPPQHEQQDQTNQTHPATHGFAELSTSIHRWAFLHPDTLYFDLQVEDPQEEALPEEEAAEDSLEEEAAEDSLEEEAVDSPAEEDLYKVILKEDHQEIDS